MARPGARVLFLGLDAADGGLIGGWCDQGRLPHLAELRARGASAVIRNAPGIYSGSVWPSLHTGLGPGRHGRYFYRRLAPGSYRTAHVGPDAIAGTPVWSAASAAGLRTVVVDLPKAPLVTTGGVQVAEWFAHDPEGPLRTHPPELARELVERYGADPVGPCDRAGRDAEGLARLRDALRARIERKATMLVETLATRPWDLCMAAFADSHCAGHQLWALHDPAHPEHDPAAASALGDPLRDVYAALDAAIGRVLAAVDEGTTVLVVASHGMTAHHDGTFLLDEVLERLEGGAPPAGRAVRRLGALWRRLPAGLRAPLAASADRFDDRVKAAGRARRRAFQVPTNDNAAGIRFNVVGREPAGRVERGPELDALRDELEAELHALVELETGEPVVREILRTAEVFPGPLGADLPDLLVRWNRARPIRGVRSARIGTIARTYGGRRTGDHRNPGFLLARGPGIASRRLADVDVVDVAPTLARLLGFDLDDVDGTPVAALAPTL
jgi:predicted AlkP superfamily phosphohydrolase/phosphomutase